MKEEWEVSVIPANAGIRCAVLRKIQTASEHFPEELTPSP